MNTLTDRISRLVRRRPFAVLGYSAEDETYCPTCLRLATGLSPHGIDTNGKPVLALYAREPLVRDEVCCSCRSRLVDLVPGLQPSITFRVQRRVPLPESTVVRFLPVGTMVLHADGRGTLFTNLLDEPLLIFKGEGSAAARAELGPIVARPPVIRRHARLRPRLQNSPKRVDESRVLWPCRVQIDAPRTSGSNIVTTDASHVRSAGTTSPAVADE